MTPLDLQPPEPSRSPWQRFYGSVLSLRRSWYRQRAQRLPVPVLSIGNLHWGGAGKTPLTAAIAAHPLVWASVGSGNEDSNQARVASEK